MKSWIRAGTVARAFGYFQRLSKTTSGGSSAAVHSITSEDAAFRPSCSDAFSNLEQRTAPHQVEVYRLVQSQLSTEPGDANFALREYRDHFVGPAS